MTRTARSCPRRTCHAVAPRARTTHASAQPAARLQRRLGNQGLTRLGPTLQAQRAAVTPAAGLPPCDAAHAADVETARSTARDWRRAAVRWLDNHLDHLRQRARVPSGPYVTVGDTIVGELRLLNRHFRIADELRERRTLLPMSAGDRVSATDLENVGSASYWVRRRMREVDLGALAFGCEGRCPRGRRGSDVLGRAQAGSREFTIFTDCFDAQHPTTKAGVVMHESFHASFSECSGDTYSFEAAYPGPAPMTNAESLTMFAAEAATGRGYRIVPLPEMRVTGSPAAP